MLVLSAETVGVVEWSVSAEMANVAAWSVSAEMASMAALGHVLAAVSAHTSVRAEAVVWAPAWALAQVLAVASVLSSAAASLEAGVCLPHSQAEAQSLLELVPLLDAGEGYRLAVDAVGLYWEAAPPWCGARGWLSLTCLRSQFWVILALFLGLLFLWLLGLGILFRFRVLFLFGGFLWLQCPRLLFSLCFLGRGPIGSASWLGSAAG